MKRKHIISGISATTNSDRLVSTVQEELRCGSNWVCTQNHSHPTPPPLGPINAFPWSSLPRSFTLRTTPHYTRNPAQAQTLPMALEKWKQTEKLDQITAPQRGTTLFPISLSLFISLLLSHTHTPNWLTMFRALFRFLKWNTHPWVRVSMSASLCLCEALCGTRMRHENISRLVSIARIIDRFGSFALQGGQFPLSAPCLRSGCWWWGS